MKKNYDAAKTVAISAIMGNIDDNVIKRMVMLIADQTTDANIFYSLLKGLVVDVKVKDKEKLAKLISKSLEENICKIVNAEIIIRDQDVRITYVCKRYAKTADETKAYNTNKMKNDSYTYEVEVQDNCWLTINRFDFEDSLEFEII